MSFVQSVCSPKYYLLYITDQPCQSINTVFSYAAIKFTIDLPHLQSPLYIELGNATRNISTKINHSSPNLKIRPAVIDMSTSLLILFTKIQLNIPCCKTVVTQNRSILSFSATDYSLLLVLLCDDFRLSLHKQHLKFGTMSWVIY